MKHLLLLLTGAIFLQVFCPRTAIATTNDEDPLVEINYPIDVRAPYKERRRTHGANFGTHLEAYVPNLWESMIDEQYYEDTYEQTPIQLTSFEGGYKYNFILGSISLLAGLGYGEANTIADGTSRNMTAFKYYARALYAMDNIFPEPYVVPYVAGSIWKMRIEESEDISDAGGSFTSGVGFDYSLGVLLQLNWLDKDLAAESLNENGIQNTFIDVFVTQYLKTLTADDPSLASNFILGLGLRLEF